MKSIFLKKNKQKKHEKDRRLRQKTNAYKLTHMRKNREQGWVYGSSKEQVRKRQGGVCVLAKTVASNKYQAPEGVGRVEEETSVKN